MPRRRPDHFLDSRNAIKENYSHAILSRRPDFLLVAKSGEPNFAERPLAVTSAFVSVSDFEISGGTRLALPREESAARLAVAHSVLIEPVHRFLAQNNRPAVKVCLEMMDLVSMVAAASGEDTVSVHAVYPNLHKGHEEEVASAVFVSRRLCQTKQMIGTIPDFDERKIHELDIDLLELIAAEQDGAQTSLRTYNGGEARALGAVGLLVDQPTLQAQIDNMQ